VALHALAGNAKGRDIVDAMVGYHEHGGAQR
jgi:hypothetical protein